MRDVRRGETEIERRKREDFRRGKTQNRTTERKPKGLQNGT